MAAHAAPPPAAAPAGGDADQGFERRVARWMPRVMLAAVGVLGVVWWMAAQPPPGPGWDDPNGPQAGQGEPPYPPQPPPPPPRPATESSFCSSIDCGDCASVDCGDCADCGDCLSGIDCSGIDCSCAVAPSTAGDPAGTPSLRALAGAGVGDRRTCSRTAWKRVAGSSGILLPLLVLIGWRRRLRRV